MHGDKVGYLCGAVWGETVQCGAGRDGAVRYSTQLSRAGPGLPSQCLPSNGAVSRTDRQFGELTSRRLESWREPAVALGVAIFPRAHCVWRHLVAAEGRRWRPHRAEPASRLAVFALRLMNVSICHLPKGAVRS